MNSRLSPGAVTVRSNIVLEQDRWDLVPGELLYKWRGLRNATNLQHAEHMYYQPCCVCDRTIAAINLHGCTRCPHGPAPAEVAKAQKQHQRATDELLVREQADIANPTGETRRPIADGPDISKAAA